MAVIAFKHIPKDLRTKLKPKSARHILVGCSQKGRAFQLRQPGTRKNSVSVDVIIDETMCNFNEPGDNLVGLEEVVHFLDTPSSFPVTLAGVDHNFSSTSDFNGPSGPSEAGTWTEDFPTPHDSDPLLSFRPPFSEHVPEPSTLDVAQLFVHCMRTSSKPYLWSNLGGS